MKIYCVNLLITLRLKDQPRVPWKVAQSVKRMLCKHEDLRARHGALYVEACC